VTSTSTTILVDVRYFAAARAAAGVDAEAVTVNSETTVAELADLLGRRNLTLAKVLARCSYLCDGIAVRDSGMRLRAGQTVDVLPPFAGG
jgi:sulfur-carrier protein